MTIKQLINSRFPRGKRGLKYDYDETELETVESLPPREAWIEMRRRRRAAMLNDVASPAGSVD